MSYLEKQILGCFLKDNSLLNETIISSSHFKESANQILYKSMKQLSSENKAIDQVTLMSMNYDLLMEMGGPEFITGIETTGDTEHFESYERQFIDNFKQRESEKMAKDWLSKNKKDNQDLINNLQKLDEIGYTDDSDKNETLMRMALEPDLEGVEQAGVPSGLNDLDMLTGGFHNQQSYILGARPSMGKTATMLKFALSAAEHGAVPLLFSLEMSEESLLRRLIATKGQINLFLTKNPSKLTKGKKESWKEAVNDLYNLDFEIYDKPMQTIQYIRTKVRQAKRKYEGKQIIVLIDYLTLIHNAGEFHSDHAKVSDISARLKAISKEYDCPVITLAQLSRAVEQRQDKRPLLSDLRESGSIEQDADMIMFLYRESYYDREIKNDDLEIIVAKHRDGPTGFAKVYYNKSTGIMGDLA